MQYSQISKYAQQDLQKVMDFLNRTGQSTGKLPDAIKSDSAIIETHIRMVLKDGNYERATPYTKRLVGMLMAYADRLAAGDVDGYGRDNQVGAVREANRKPGRVSVVSRVSLPEDLEDWWDNLTPEERGDFLAAHRPASEE